MRVTRTGFAYLDEPRLAGAVVAMAHRGGALHPDLVGIENTRTAFAAAVALGYRYLETDVQATRDGVLLAFHDEALDRVTGRAGSIGTLDRSEVADVLVGDREPIPVLGDLLAEFPATRFNIDLKTSATVEPMVALLREHDAHDRVCIGSFSGRVLRRFRDALGADRDRVATAVTVVGTARHRFAPWSGWPATSGPVFQVPVRHRGVVVVDAAFVRRAHARGRHVHVWTVDERAEMDRLIDMGVDGLITDRTDVLKDVLVERGLWEAS